MKIISKEDAKRLNLKVFFTGKLCKNLHKSERSVKTGKCLECCREARKRYSDKCCNKEKIRERSKRYRKNNADKIAKSDKEYRVKNRDRISVYGYNYRSKNKEKISEKNKLYHRKNELRNLIRHSLRRIEVATGRNRTQRAEVELGYTQSELIKHIESQFQEGMTWDNRSEWHIDHIKPIKAFLDEGVTDPKIINALDNLQPLWAFDNLSKGTKLED